MPKEHPPHRSSLATVLSVLALLAFAGWGALLLKRDPAPPGAWREAAGASDVLEVAGHRVAYWGNPTAQYSRYATRGRQKPIAVVVHFTYPKPLLRLVKYGHTRDPRRGNASFGYHFYVGRDGRIVQGAPLSRRTNHIKSTRRSERTGTARNLWSGNTIGVSLVGGCDPGQLPQWDNATRCGGESVTPTQLRAGLAVIRALQARYDMACDAVYGHGQLQTDRQEFEGLTLTELAQVDCELRKLNPDGDVDPAAAQYDEPENAAAGPDQRIQRRPTEG